MPKQCPECGSAVVKEGQVAIRCVNSQCPAQVWRRIEHFASRGAMTSRAWRSGRESAGPAKLLGDVGDIYSLAPNANRLERMGEKA
jgi:DNA ligase (NAD+)